MAPSLSLVLTLILLFLSSACSTPHRVRSGYSTKELRIAACNPGQGVSSVQGHLWMKASSNDFSGQFPADVSVQSPDQLKLEIVNLLGGTEARVVVNRDHYQIWGEKGQRESKNEGYGSWGGIPLRWAVTLFLGKIPCPEMDKKLRFSLNEDGGLVVDTQGPLEAWAERFTFEFQEHQGKPWPSFLKWQRLDMPGSEIDFKFEDPDRDTLSPSKWEATSKTGKIKIRWKSREFSRHTDNLVPRAMH